MANYCKKSSLESIADEIRVRNGDSSSTKYLFPSGFTSTISGLLIPTQRGAPSKELKTNDSSYTIPKGVYTGGSVFVDPIEWSSVVQSSSSQQTIKDTTNNKPLKKVTVAAANSHPVATGEITVTSSSNSSTTTSVSVSGLSFKPVGFIILTSSTFLTTSPYYFIRWFCALSDGTVYGYAKGRTSVSSTFLGAKINSASVSFNQGSVSVSNIICYDTGYGNQTAYFYGAKGNKVQHAYYVWG